MADNIPTCLWLGKSGTQYSYYVLQLPVFFHPNQPGNYIYTRLNDQNKWTPIFIGQGQLSEWVGPNHPQATCITIKGATHVHVHSTALEEDRAAEVKDLLAMYTNSCTPNGCN